MIRIEKLAGHDRGRFDCGVAELNDWLRTQASQQQRKDNAVTFVALHPDDGRVVGVELVVVHAISDSAVEFYERDGFTRFIDVDRSLFITLRAIRKLLA